MCAQTPAAAWCACGSSPSRAAEGSEQVEGDFPERMVRVCHPLMSAQCKEQSQVEKLVIFSLCRKIWAENFWWRLLDSDCVSAWLSPDMGFFALEGPPSGAQRDLSGLMSCCRYCAERLRQPGREEPGLSLLVTMLLSRGERSRSLLC